MKLTFLGTRGFIEPKTRRHRHYASILVGYRRGRVMVDAGKGWEQRWHEIDPDAIVITHPHPDHAFALRNSAPPCTVYATREAWERMADFAVPSDLRRELTPREPVTIAGISFEPFPVLHSVRAPAVGYRISAGRVTIFYVPDVVWIHDREDALRGARMYIGDGATIHGNMIRRDSDSGELIGHAPITQQLTWCHKEGVSRMIITHCGSEIVGGDERSLRPELKRLGKERGVEVEVAHDGLVRVLR